MLIISAHGEAVHTSDSNSRPHCKWCTFLYKF